MNTYVRRPTQIQAIRLESNTRKQIIEWIGDQLIYELAMNLVISNGRGKDIMAHHGDFIVKDPTGKFYPIRPDTFHQKYSELTPQ